MTTGAMPREPIAVSKRRKVVQVGKCAGGRLVGSSHFEGVFLGSHLRLHLVPGYDSSAHFDCAEDYGDWQSKWTDESWRQILHFTRLVFTSTCWTHVSPGSRNPQNRWGQESLVLRHSCASACWWFCLWKGGMCHICTSMILFSKWWSRSSLFDQPSNGIQWPKRSNMSK